MIEEAIFRSIKKYPYFARGFLAMTAIREDRCKTMGIDKYWRLYYNHEFLSELKSYFIPDIFAHELEHLLRNHHDRGKGKIPNIWNLATDAEINDDYDSLPIDCILPSTLGCDAHLAAEDYYNKILSSDDNIESLKGACSGGSGAGNEQEWERDPPDEKSLIDTDIMISDIAADIVSYHNKHPGNVSDELVVWANAVRKGKLPKISWQKIIGSKIRNFTAGRSNYTWGKINRRQDSRDAFILPGLHRPIPDIAIIVDTSGSMNELGDWVAGCINDVVKMKCNSVLISCNCSVVGTKKLKNWSDVKTCIGGGGTDMTVGIEFAKNYDLIIVLTDGYTPWPDVWPRKLFAVINSGNKIEVRNAKI